MANNWITDPKVLETIKALREIRPGDEIKVKPCHTPDHDEDDENRYNQWQYKEALVVASIDSHPRFPINVKRKKDGIDTWSACYCQIIAWRRPHG